MKKNYSEPKIKVQTIALQQMIAASWEDDPVIPINPEEEAGGDGDAKDNLLDGLFD